MIQTLQEAGFDVFEIRDSQLWGGGAVCVRNADDREAARLVVEEFQQSWQERARETRRDSKPNYWMIIPIVLILLVVLLVNLGFIL